MILLSVTFVFMVEKLAHLWKLVIIQ